MKENLEIKVFKNVGLFEIPIYPSITSSYKTGVSPPAHNQTKLALTGWDVIQIV